MLSTYLAIFQPICLSFESDPFRVTVVISVLVCTGSSPEQCPVPGRAPGCSAAHLE